MMNSTLTCSADWTCGELAQSPRWIAGNVGALGCTNGLPRKNARPVPNSIRPMPTAMSLTRGRLQIEPCSSPSATPANAGHQHAEPRAAGQVGDAVAAHRAHHQDAFEAEVDAAALLGEAFAEAHEQKRRADADGTAEHRDRNAPPARSSASAIMPDPAGRRRGEDLAKPAIQRLGREDHHEGDPLQHQHVASGRSSRRCSKPPLAEMPPTSTATGNDRIGLWRR